MIPRPIPGCQHISRLQVYLPLLSQQVLSRSILGLKSSVNSPLPYSGSAGGVSGPRRLRGSIPSQSSRLFTTHYVYFPQQGDTLPNTMSSKDKQTFSVTVSSCGSVRVEQNYPAGELLLEFPSGPYTTMRTVGRDGIFALDEHIARLSHSMAAMLKATELQPAGDEGAQSNGTTTTTTTTTAESITSDAPLSLLTHEACPVMHLAQDALQPTRLKELLIPPLRGSVLAMRDHAKLADDAALKITVLLTSKERRVTPKSHLEIICHVQSLAQPPYKPVEVALATDARVLGATKSSAWVSDRAKFMGQFHEILLMTGKDQGVCEGSQTNVFIVDKSGTVWTANEGVVNGTMRTLILEACRNLQIPVRLQAPSLRDSETWAEGFISSTSRIVLPLQRIVFTHPDLVGREPLEFGPTPITDGIRRAVEDMMVSRSQSFL